jgi:glycosyltransferase involved in cell wall biosynthesis
VTKRDALPVTVVVPCYNSGATITRAMDSVAAQTSAPAEVIVMDDASTDDTADVLNGLASQSWPFDVRLGRLPKNRGPGGAREAAWAMARPDTRYVAFLDADDTWWPAKLERQVSWMEARPGIAWTAHRCTIVSSLALPSASPVVPRGIPITRRQLLLRNGIATPTVVARRSVRSRFREGWRHCEDLMLWLDWLDEGNAAAMLDVPLATLGRPPCSPGGSTGDLAAMSRGEMRVLRTLVDEGRLSRAEACVWRAVAWVRYARRRIVA